MKKLLFPIVVSLFILPSIFSQNNFNPVGIWQGKININPTVQLSIVLHIDKKEDGTLNASMDSPDQSAYGIKVDKITASQDSLHFIVMAIAGNYHAEYNKDSLMLLGKWSQGAYSFPLNLKKTDKVEEAKRPQLPAKPYPYNEEEVVFENKIDSIKLGGSFTYPKEGNNFSAVVLITGSGWEDRDETIFNHKPFLVIADYLTRKGFAVLRFDDRGGGASTGNATKATTLDFVKDVKAAVDYLKTRKEVNQNKIGLIGHSEGGMIAPLVASERKDIAFIILLAGPGLTGEEILIRQAELISKAEGIPDQEIEKNAKLSKSIYAELRKSKDAEDANKHVKNLLEEYVQKLSDSEKKELGDTKAFVEQQSNAVSSPWFKFFLTYDPVPVLEKVKCPVLALNGEKDLQVPAKEDLEAIETALKMGKNKNYKTLLLPGLNHLFQTAQTGSPNEYGKIEETFSPVALQTISDWLKEILQ
ncbi:MAG: alpha/beta fold hydrolase [Ignavibacteriaceae bacterium]|nr:alpha/beta fold hydrolase [Ignavibacteriaceae bacterium]